jgi:hypothetical protein
MIVADLIVTVGSFCQSAAEVNWRQLARTGANWRQPVSVASRAVGSFCALAFAPHIPAHSRTFRLDVRTRIVADAMGANGSVAVRLGASRCIRVQRRGSYAVLSKVCSSRGDDARAGNQPPPARPSEGTAEGVGHPFD